jgi:hypothetical protein
MGEFMVLDFWVLMGEYMGEKGFDAEDRRHPDHPRIPGADL